MLVAGGIIVWRWFYAYRHYGPAAIWRWTAPAVWAFIILVGLCLLGIYLLWQSRGLQVSLYQHGLVLKRGKVRKAIRWDVIEQINTASVRYGMARLAWGDRKFLRIRTNDGLRINFTTVLTNLDLLIKTIKRHVYPNLLSIFRTRLNEGGSISFGALLLTKHGVQHSQQFLSWDSIHQVTLDQGMLIFTVRENDKEVIQRFPAHQIPNVDLCIQLLAHLRGTAIIGFGDERKAGPVAAHPIGNDESQS
jgi:hypothetical protein